jgi:hypothetical protein
MKMVIILVSFILFGLVLYGFGNYKGVNDASFMLCTIRAFIETGTINYIGKGKCEQAKQLNLTDLESSISNTVTSACSTPAAKTELRHRGTGKGSLSLNYKFMGH